MNDFYTQLELCDSTVAHTLLERIEENPDVVNMHYGAPVYDPISDFADSFREECLNPDFIHNAIKDYGFAKGSHKLRKAVSKFYQTKYDINVDPEKEIIITNGSVEALVLAILSTTEPQDTITITNPTYLLFKNIISSLDRQILSINRFFGTNEYQSIFSNFHNSNSKCLIINSPENPTGYVLSNQDWQAIESHLLRTGSYLIHDEVLSEFDFAGIHKPAFSYPSLRKNTIMVNGFSKTYGLPGIKIGWIIAPSNIIKKAEKLHDYLYLSVNPMSDSIAANILEHKELYSWLERHKQELKNRRDTLVKTLNEHEGYEWPAYPNGGLSATPKITKLYDFIPKKYKSNSKTKGASIAEYLFKERRVSVTPGSIYGDQLNDHIKIVTCIDKDQFNLGLGRLKCDLI